MNNVILYATKKGKSKTIAEKISEDTGFKVIDAKTIKPEDLVSYNKIVWVVSSYGFGVAPKAYLEWWDEIEKFSGDLSSVSFAVFGCGSTKYAESFLGFPKTVEAKMLSLGATKIAEMGVSDAKNQKSTDINEFIAALQ